MFQKPVTAMQRQIFNPGWNRQQTMPKIYRGIMSTCTCNLYSHQLYYHSVILHHIDQSCVLRNRKILEGIYFIPEHWSPVAKDVITQLLQVSTNTISTSL